jgi:hypothetical protein
MAAPELLSLSDLGSFAGAMAAVVAITNTLRHVFNLNPRIVGFIASFAVCLAALILKPDPRLEQLILAILNAFIVYCGAAGMSGIGAQIGAPRRQRKMRATKPDGATPILEEATQLKHGFFDPWY